MAQVKVEVQADFKQVTKDVKGFERVMSGMGQTLQKALGAGSGSRSPLQGVSKQMQELTRRAQEAQRQVSDLDRALAKVRADKGAFGPTIGRKDRYEALVDQEKRLQRLRNNAATRLGDLSLRRDTAEATPDGAPDDDGGSSGRRSRPLSKTIMGAASVGGLAEMAEGALGSLGPLGLIAGAAVGITAVVGVKAAMQEMKAKTDLADWLPRVLGRQHIGDEDSVETQMRRIGLPLGFTGRQSFAIGEAMSAGGSKFSTGLGSDIRTAMQMGRMFGLDAGGEASNLAGAQRMGAFRPGDARRFANMLAKEIAITGMGPRAAEAQDATLMLLNRQMQNMPSSRPGAVMAIQALFDKTGIPAFQGHAGASLIARMDEGMKSPGGDAQQAVAMSVFRKLHPKGNFFDFQKFLEEGVSAPGALGGYVNFFKRNTRSPGAFQYFLREQLHVPMLQSQAGHLDHLTDAQIRAMEKRIRGGKDLLGTSSNAAMNMTGNQIRHVEAALDYGMSKIGTPIVKGLAGLGDRVVKAVEHSDSILDGINKVSAELLNVFLPGGKSTSVTEVPSHGTKFTPPAVAEAFRKSGATWEQFDHQMAAAQRRRGGPPPILPPAGSGMRLVPHPATVDNEDWPHYVARQHHAMAQAEKRLHITVEHRDGVSEHGKRAVKKLIKDTLEEHGHVTVRQGPNVRGHGR